MQVQGRSERKLAEGLGPSYLEVVNASGMHNVPPDAETHFRVFVVADAFEGKPLVQRHRMVYRLLEVEKRDHVHALGIEALTPTEHAARGATSESPPCLGGDGTSPG